MKEKEYYRKTLVNIALSIFSFWLIQLIAYLFATSSPDAVRDLKTMGWDFVTVAKVISGNVCLLLPPFISLIVFRDPKYFWQSFLLCLIQGATLTTLISLFVTQDFTLFGKVIKIM
jgi:Na+/proline symporter